MIGHRALFATRDSPLDHCDAAVYLRKSLWLSSARANGALAAPSFI